MTMIPKFYKHPVFYLSVLACMVGALAACNTAPKKSTPIEVAQPPKLPAPQTPKPTSPHPATKTTPTPAVTPSVSAPAPIVEPKQFYGSFGEWKSDFINRAIARGYRANDVYALMNNASLNQQVISLDGKQAEFAKMPWEYAESATSGNRVSTGRAKADEYPSLLSRLESRYGVPREIVVAIWGMESSYGAATGNTDLVNALSSLAYDGRRRSFAEGELIAMLDMINRGDVNRSQLKGSWAGGMGHTQFIPSTWLAQGVDGNNDGQKNPWVISDALSSTANYLSGSGWIAGLDAFYEVRLPSHFNHQLIGQKQPLSTWQQAGLISINGASLPNSNTPAELWLPAGILGPALLLTPNFDVIKVYNNSSNYALGVALLAKRISKQSGIVSNWPRHERPLSSAQVRRLQENLNAKGYNAGTPDGMAGTNTRRAFAQWQSDNGKIPDGFITQNSANELIW